jgi:hypothetical protein
VSEEDDFKARLAEEREFRDRFLKEKAGDIRRLKKVVDGLVANVTSMKSVMPVVVEQRESKRSKHEWQLVPTEFEGKMISVLTAYRDGEEYMEFYLDRHRDGFVKQILGTPL